MTKFHLNQKYFSIAKNAFEIFNHKINKIMPFYMKLFFFQKANRVFLFFYSLCKNDFLVKSNRKIFFISQSKSF